MGQLSSRSLPRAKAAEKGGALLGIEAEEDEAAPFGQRDGIEREVFPVETLRRGERRHAAEIAFQVIAPGMIGAGDELGLETPLRLPAEHGAAMAAGVVEGAQRPILVADDEGRLPADRDRLEAAGLLQRVGPEGVDPVAGPERPQLALVLRGVVVERARQGWLEPFRPTKSPLAPSAVMIRSPPACKLGQRHETMLRALLQWQGFYSSSRAPMPTASTPCPCRPPPPAHRRARPGACRRDRRRRR